MARTIKLIFLFLCISVATSAAAGSAGLVRKVPGTARINDKTSDTAWVNYYIQKGFYHMTKEGYNLAKVEAYIDTASLICEKKEFDYPASLHLLRSEYFYEKGDFSKSETDAKQAVRKAENNAEYPLLAKTMIFLGRYYMRIGFYQQSIDYFKKSITLADEKGLKNIKPIGYRGQATVFSTVGDTKAYISNLERMIIAAREENDTVNVEEGLLRLGTLYTTDNRDNRKADSLLRECVRLSLLKKDSYYTSFAMANLGWNFYGDRMYDSSIANYERSLKFSIPYKHIGISANALGNLGTIYRDLGKNNLALKYYSKSIDQAQMINDFYGLSWVYNDMSKLYLTNRDTAKAFETYVLYKQFNDSLMSNRNTQRLLDARIRFDADAHAKEIALLSLRLKNNRIINIGYSVLVVLIIAIGVLIFSRSKINAKRRISEMNHKISEITQANLRQQMNPHFIFNTLNSIQYYMYQHDKLATNNYLTKFSSLMRKVLDNSQHTSVPLRDELDALNLYLELECLRFKDKFEFQINVDEEIDPLLYKVPTMLIQPYVENSICHGLMPLEGKGFVKIDMKLEKEYILCTIEDNGIGRDAATERKKKRETNHNSLGTQIAASRLDLVNTLYGTSLKTIYTDLRNEKGEAEGTRVELHIPILT